MSLIKKLNRMGRKLQPCFSPMLDVKEFFVPFGKRILG